VKQDKVKIHSFDVFDTVITRTVGFPRSLYRALGQRLQESSILEMSPESFYYARISAEERAYQNDAPLRQPTLKAIYSELQYDLNLSNETAEKIMQAEMALEKETIRVIPEMENRVLEARKKKRRIIFISDMYLPETFLKETLMERGIFFEGDGLYVSSSYRAAKRTGQLFKEILRVENILPAEMIHCGNDPVADVKSPRKLGICVTPYFKANLNRYETLMETFTLRTMGEASFMAGASRLSRLKNTAINQKETVISEIGASVIAPLLVSYVFWILNQAENKKLRRLYFVSRDGQVLFEIAKLLKAKLSLPLELRYLYGSRQAWHLPALTQFDEIAVRWMLGSWKSTPASILKRVEMSAEDLKDLLDKYKITPQSLDKPSNPLSDHKMEKMFADSLFQQRVLEKAKEKREIVREYFRQEGLFEATPYGVVDLGWQGYLQRSFYQLMKEDKKKLPLWFFWGVKKTYVGGGEGAYEAFMFDEPRKKGDVRSAVQHMEVFCKADHECVVGYYKTADGIKPEFLSQETGGAGGLTLPILREAIRLFIENFPFSTWNTSGLSRCRELTVRILDVFQGTPTKEEAVVWGQAFYDHDQTGLHATKMAERISLKDVCDVLVFGRTLSGRGSTWPQACYKLTPSTLVFFYRLASYFARTIRPLIKRTLFGVQAGSRDACVISSPAQSYLPQSTNTGVKRVSVIIPLYNGQRFIERAILSVFQQTKLPYELIIVDDASSDDSFDIARRAVSAAPIPVRILSRTKNSGGPAAPLNFGIKEACGDLIAILDQDDYYMPEKIEKLSRVLSSHRSIRFIFSRGIAPDCHEPGYAIVQNELARVCESVQRFEDVLLLKSEDAVRLFLLYSNPPYSFSGTMFFKEDWRRKGGFDESLKIGADYDFNCWQALRGSMGFISEPLYFKEAHEKNLSDHSDCLFEDSAVFLKYFWEARRRGLLVDVSVFSEKVRKRWSYYLLRCRERKEYRAEAALNWNALIYFRFDLPVLRAMAKQMCVSLAHRLFSCIKLVHLRS